MKPLDHFSLALFGGKYKLVQFGMNASAQTLHTVHFVEHSLNKSNIAVTVLSAMVVEKSTEFGVCTLRAYSIPDNSKIEKL